MMMIGTRRTVGLVGMVGFAVCHSVQAHEASVQHLHMGMCPTGDPRTIMINQKTGVWKILEDYYDDDFLANYLESKAAHPTNSSSGFDENELSVRRQLRKGFEHILLPDEDPLLFSNPADGSTAHEIHRLLSTDGSNSLATELSANGNADDDETEDGGNVLFARVRPCACGSHQEDDFVALCPETSGWCGMSSANATSTVSARCFYESKMSVVARNTWPLLWMWYIFIGLSVCCTFNGRIVLDFVKGTILYTICGFGDPFQNFNARNVNRYNDSIVNEIIREEREDREDVRRRRNDGSIVSRQMDAIANRTTSDADGDDQQQGVPPTIVTSPSFPMGDYGDDSSHEDGDETTEVARPSPMEWLLERFRNVVWPWQTSWKRYIKYNLLLRVEWITLRDEVAFIESRQERGLPHARYEMRTRTWTAEDAGAACSCVGSIGPSIQSVDVPHCTICFSELEEGDIVGDLGCSHVFHADCLKMWVTKRNSCPLCNIPIARRKRISSEELVKENTNNDAGEDSFVAAAANPTTNDMDSFDYDHTLPPYSATTTTGYLTTPSHHQRRGPRRLSHMPTTPSTVAEDTYSNFSDDLDLDNVGSGGESPSPSAIHDPLPTPMDREESLVSTPTTSQRVDEVVDDTGDASSDNPARALSLDRCNIDDFLSRSGGDQQESALDHAENDGSGLAIPSPPRRIRRIADGTNESSRSAGCGYDYGYSAAFVPTTEDGHDGTTQRHSFEQRTPKPADETAPLQCRKSNPEQDEDPNCEQQQQQNLGADRHCCSGDDDDHSPQQQPQNLGADHHSSSGDDDDDLPQVLNDTTKPSCSSLVSDEIPREQQHSEVDR